MELRGKMGALADREAFLERRVTEVEVLLTEYSDALEVLDAEEGPARSATPTRSASARTAALLRR